jgi:hypothetical protein
MITGKLVSAFTVLSIYKMEGAVVLNIPTETFYTVQSNEQSLGIDIDGNGTQDFRFGGVTRIGSLIVTERNNRYFGKAASFPDLGGLPSALESNSIIGNVDANLVFLSSDSGDGFVEPGEINVGATLYQCITTGCIGNFLPAAEHLPFRRFLGFQFEAETGTHFGFFDLDYQAYERRAIIKGWAYESEPGVAITTSFIPEPSAALLSFLTALSSVFMRVRKTKI